MKVDYPRSVALKILHNIDEGAYSNIELNKEISKNKSKLTKLDISFISNLVYGVTTNKILLDFYIKNLSNIKVKKISPWIINILRMGIYQIILMDKVPKSAATNTSVDLAKKYGNKGSVGFVNAILRKIDKQILKTIDCIKDTREKIHIKYSLPLELIDILSKDYSLEQIEEFAKVYNMEKNVSIRINTSISNKEEVKKYLDSVQIQYEEGHLEDFLILKNGYDIENLDIFLNGSIFIQDEMASMPAIVLNPSGVKQEYILDACAAPGGKTTYISELSNGVSKILATDIHKHRLRLIEENVKRLKHTNIQTKILDATIVDENMLNTFDKILLDVPCMGLGVIRSKKDIKYGKDEKQLKEILDVQQKILDTVSKYLKPGGELIYSTCSILKCENEEQIEKFLEKNEGYEREEVILDKKGSKQFSKYLDDGYFKAIPTKENEGFFIAKLRKKV